MAGAADTGQLAPPVGGAASTGGVGPVRGPGPLPVFDAGVRPLTRAYAGVEQLS